MVAIGDFHVAVRIALAIGTLAAGDAVDILGDREVLGLEPIRLVLIVAGALSFASAIQVSRDAGDAELNPGFNSGLSPAWNPGLNSGLSPAWSPEFAGLGAGVVGMG